MRPRLVSRRRWGRGPRVSGGSASASWAAPWPSTSSRLGSRSPRTLARRPRRRAFVAAGASLADSPAAVAAASDVMMFTMVGNPSDIRAVVLDPATGALACLRPGGLLVDWTSSSPFLSREIAAAAPPQCAMVLYCKIPLHNCMGRPFTPRLGHFSQIPIPTLTR